MPTEIVQYKNKPILKITQENSYIKLFIGLKKARLILDNIDTIKSFIADNTNNIHNNLNNSPLELQGSTIIHK